MKQKSEMCVHMFFLYFLISTLFRGRVSINPTDCWDEEKLKSMSQNQDNEHDVNLSKFNMMVKCLMQERSPGSSGSNVDWNQFRNVAQSGRFPTDWSANNPPKQNYPEDRRGPNRNNNNQGYRERQPPPTDWIRPGQNNPRKEDENWSNPKNRHVGGQPRPGVHPEDWNDRRNELAEDRRDNNNNRFDGNKVNTPVWGQPSDNIYSPKKEGKKRMSNGNNRGNRKQNRDNKRVDENRNAQDFGSYDNRMSLNPDGNIRDTNNIGGRYDSSWEDRPINGADDSFVSADFGGNENLSLHRKYGYAVMAMSVVVLAVLMVSTIFCCNSSNSTMSQPAVAGIAQLDNYSLYSYKQGMVLPTTTDTLRSGTIRSSMRTDTLRSSATTQQFRSSPQYRVSDIDPDFARRYKEENHY